MEGFTFNDNIWKEMLCSSMKKEFGKGMGIKYKEDENKIFDDAFSNRMKDYVFEPLSDERLYSILITEQEACTFFDSDYLQTNAIKILNKFVRCF